MRCRARAQNVEFGGGQLKSEIIGEPLLISPEGLVESLGTHTVEPRQIGIKNYPLPAHYEDEQLERLITAMRFPSGMALSPVLPG